MSEYAERDAQALDRAGGHYCRHLSAMTAERLDSKSDIAAELAWRDMCVSDLTAALETQNLRCAELKTELAAVARHLREFTPGPHDGPKSADDYASELESYVTQLTTQRDEAFASFRDNMHRIGAAEGMHAREFDRARAAESVAEKLYDALCASGGVSALTKANASALMATLAASNPLDFDRSEEATE